jgi:hypothetical protein
MALACLVPYLQCITTLVAIVSLAKNITVPNVV